MKKLIVLSAIAASSLMFQSASAQIHVGLHINLGSPVVYTAPAPVYDDADYYYLPDVEAYYSVNRHMYFYNDGYNWVSAAYLPGAYRDFDLARARRFEVHEARPFMRNDVYRQRFGGVEHREWSRPYDHDRMYADRGRDNHNDYRGNDRRDNDRRDHQPQQNYGNHDYNRGQAQPQDHNRGGFGQGQQARPQHPQQNNGGGFGRGQQTQPQQPQQGGGNNTRQNNDRGGSNSDHGRHGI